jgi:RNA polymerase sigma-70 factor (ECF subfamily)
LGHAIGTSLFGASLDTIGTPLSPTEQELIAKASAGDSDAFGDLVRPHLPLFFHSILRILGDAPDAEDALQEALLSIHRDLPAFEGRARFTSWAYRICVNAALQLRRSKARRREEIMEARRLSDDESGQGMDAEAPPDWSVEAEAPWVTERQELHGHLLEALHGLPDTHRIVFMLKDLEGWDTGQIARALGLAPAAVRQRLHRARTAMQDRLRAYVQPNG